MKMLLALAAALLTAAPTAPGKPGRPPHPQGVPSRNVSRAPRPPRQGQPEQVPRDNWALLLQRVRGQGRTLWYPPPEIWLTSSRRR
jgi:hypothetical protein